MAEPDDAERAAARLEAALDRIASLQNENAANGASALPFDPRITAKLDNLIRALRTSLDS